MSVISNQTHHTVAWSRNNNCRLNEGFTTYLERKIVAKLHSEKERHLCYISEYDDTACSDHHLTTCTLLLYRWLEGSQRCGEYIIILIEHMYTDTY